MIAFISWGILVWVLAVLPDTTANQPPILTAVRLNTFGQPRVNQFYQCDITDFEDPDQDGVTESITFLINDQWFCCSDSQTSRVFLSGDKGFQRGDRVKCEVQLQDSAGGKSQIVGSNEIIIANSPPSVRVQVEPERPTTNTPLNCTIVSFSDPDDTSGFTFDYSWYVNQAKVPLENSPSLDPLDFYFNKGDKISCSVVASDSQDSAFPSDSPVVIIADSRPEVLSASIPGGPHYTRDDLQCIPGSVFDADGDVDYLLTYRWHLNGLPLPVVTRLTDPPTMVVLPIFTRGPTQAPTISLSPSTGPTTTTIAPSASPSVPVLVDSSAPSVSLAPTASLSPTTRDSVAWSNETTSNETNATGWEEEADVVEYANTIAPTPIMPVLFDNTSALPSVYTNKNDTVTCTVRASSEQEPENLGSAATSNVATIANTPPRLYDVDIYPEDPRTDSNLTCITGYVEDDDSSDVLFSYLFKWRVNSIEVGETGEELNEVAFRKGSFVECAAQPHDGDDPGDFSPFANVTIGNSPPTLLSVLLRPENLKDPKKIICIPGEVQDLDRMDTIVDIVTLWSINGVVKEDYNEPYLNSTAWDRGDSVFCTVEVSDGMDWTGRVRSNLVVLDTPIITEIIISDPNNKDNIYGVGDRISLLFDRPTNRGHSGVDPIGLLLNRSRVDSLFQFDSPIGDDYTGVWMDDSNIIITIIDNKSKFRPLVGLTMATIDLTAGVRNKEENSLFAAGTYGPMTGSYGDVAALWVWGEVKAGLENTAYTTPQPVREAWEGDLQVVGLAAGDRHILVVLSNQTLHSMGHNDHGQLGLGAEELAEVPGYGVRGSRVVPSLTFVASAPAVLMAEAGADFSVVLDVDGGLWTAGQNRFGQIGQPSSVLQQGTLQPLSLPDAPGDPADLGHGVSFDHHEQALGGAGPGGYGEVVVVATIAAGAAFTVAVGQPQAFVYYYQIEEELYISKMAALAASATRAPTSSSPSLSPSANPSRTPSRAPLAAQDEDKDEDEDEDGTNATETVTLVSAVPVELGSDRWENESHYRVVMNVSYEVAGTSTPVWAFGRRFGAVYGGSSSFGPRRVRGIGAVLVTQAAAGVDHVMFLSDKGDLYGWGRNAEGQLGLGESSPATLASPELLMTWTGAPVYAIAAGGFHSLAIALDGSVYCWGRNNDNQCGAASPSRVMTPTIIPSSAFGPGFFARAVSAGESSTFIVDFKGNLYALGWNVDSVLGDLPQQVKTPQLWKPLRQPMIQRVAHGKYVAAAATVDGPTDCVADCSYHGGCYTDECTCDDVWGGLDCREPRCAEHEGRACNGNGTCVMPDTFAEASEPFCECDKYYRGAACSRPDCGDEASECGGHGSCMFSRDSLLKSRPGQLDAFGTTYRDTYSVEEVVATCDCDLGFAPPNCRSCALGFSGTACAKRSCEPLDNCNKHGKCTLKGKEVWCACEEGWTGRDCSTPVCAGDPPCSGHGLCQTGSKNKKLYAVCECEHRWTGDQCQVPMCVKGVMSDSSDSDEGAVCSGQGSCKVVEGVPLCACSGGFKGLDCSRADCSSLDGCFNRGVCEINIETRQPGCTCSPGWGGEDCATSLNFSLTLGWVIGVALVIAFFVCVGLAWAKFGPGKKRYLRHDSHNAFFDPVVRKPATRFDSWT